MLFIQSSLFSGGSVMARIAPVVFIMLIALSTACGGSDLNSKIPESAWQLDEPTDLDAASTTPEGLPQNYINHPASERRYPDPHTVNCDIPYGYPDPHYLRDGKMKHPIIGTMAIWGMYPQEFEPPPIDFHHYNLYLRLPRKSDVWHRFEIRPSPSGMISHARFRFDWHNMSSEREYFGVNASFIDIKLATPDCQVPTQEDIDRFIYEYGEFDVIFHNPTTDGTYRFSPGGSDNIKIREPISVLNDRVPAYFMWDLPINRPKQRILEELFE